MKLSDYLKITNTTPSQFANRIGTAVPTVRRYLNGTRKPKLDILRRIYKETNGAVSSVDFWDVGGSDDDQESSIFPATLNGAVLIPAGC